MPFLKTLRLFFKTHFTITLVLALLTSWNVYSQSNTFAPTQCSKAFSSIAQTQQLEISYQDYSALKTKALFIKEIEARRLINIDDWKIAQITKPDTPWAFYGEETYNDWAHAEKFTRDLPDDTPISSDLLKQIHAKATEHLFFSGYEIRRLRKLKAENKISSKEYQRLYTQINEAKTGISGDDHAVLRGNYRSSPIDELQYTGSIIGKDKTRLFSSEEFEAISNNPYIKIDPATVEKMPDGLIKAKGNYLPVAKIPEEVEKVISRTNSELSRTTDNLQKIKLLVQMEKDLVSIHPFIDGNGRSIRLFIDYILRRHGLPPALHSNEEDLIMNLDEAVKYQITGMQNYLEEYQTLQRKRPQNEP